ncbi:MULTISPECIES: serine hydrolase domain-containing protein [Dyella]|uniref:Class A beta-lactamase-related serine hydrolase n=2 Tax=Dyella TaxID=231454 RepID=A0A4R0YUE0_9GAMM|nr:MULTISPECIES: serine hydrolase domain-containing protein [Dyella]TBR40337.1 class A beta-lactamase-related serine hydrolase [Dyella terrae]TCI12081.1 class A beta-lactamase-related serine hydrolase [Dyella soli]
MQFRKIFLSIAGSLGLASATLPALAATPQPPAQPPAKPVAPSPAKTTPTPPQQHLPAERVKETLADYRQWLDKLEQRHAVAGLATAVVVDDKVVFEGTVGYANATTQEPITPETVFRLASLSKAFATAVTGVLVGDGKLSWDTKLADVLPYFKLKDAQAAEQATVRDILGQRLGLPRNTYDNMLEGDVSYEELVRKLDEVDMACGVGKCYGYQNVAFSMIGDVIYAMTGDFFYRQVDKRIFFPLGMKTASYGREALEASPSWARPHRPAGGGNWRPFEPKEAYYRVAPAAGVNASLRDMEQWLIAQMGGRPDVLSPALLETLHTPEVTTPVELRSTPWRSARLTSAHYALGWRVFTYGGETLVFHAGAVEGYRTMIGFFPKYHAGVVTMWNSAGPVPSGLMPMVLDSLLGLPHVDWAGLDSNPAAAPAKKAAPAKAKPKATKKKKAAK